MSVRNSISFDLNVADGLAGRQVVLLFASGHEHIFKHYHLKPQPKIPIFKHAYASYRLFAHN
jgi:hypothetical protein